MKIYKFIGLFILLCTGISNSGAQVLINEFSCANVSTLTDNFGETPDWIELYNAGNSSVNLAGYHLSDKISNPDKWAIPSGVSIPANGHLFIWASGKDTVIMSDVHTSFKLTQTAPEAIVFSDISGTIIDSMTLVPTQSGHSRGRVTDGAGQWAVFTTPTPGYANSGAMSEYASRPVMSVAAGFYNSSQTVAITASGMGLSIYYTTDGSVPTTLSTLYSAPVSISTTTVLRARAFSSSLSVPASFVESNTYFINVNHTVAVASVFGDQVDELLDGNFLEPETGLEYFDKNKIQVAETNGESNEHGNDSWAYPQRGFDFISKDEMGYNYGLNCQVFNTTPRQSFQRIMFKPAANDNYPFQDGGAHIRDAFAHTLSQRGGLNMDARTWAPAIVYVNGQYWGVYEVREKVDDSDYTDYYYNQPEDQLQFLQTWGGTWSAYGGTQAQTDWDALKNYILNNNMAVQANYDYVDDKFNVKSFVDYFVFNSWLVTADWLNWNTAWWRGMNPNGDKKKWRYTLWDMDAILGHYYNYTGVPDTSPEADPCNVEVLPDPDPGGQGHALILNALMANPGFKQYYQARYIDLMNTKLSCDFVLPLYDSMIAVIQPEMQAQCTKWGGNYSTWQANAATFRTQITSRCTSLTQGLMDCYSFTGPYNIVVNVEPAGSGNVKINSITPSAYAFNASYFGGIQTIFAASANTGYEFDHWRLINHVPAPNDTLDTITVSFTQPDSVIAVFREIQQPEPPEPPPVVITPGEEVGVPTGFSPNGDGYNDILYVMGTVTQLDFTIYNRWGQMVFQSSDPTVGWDGKFNGQMLNPGVFAYVLNGKDINGKTVSKRGNVTLVK